MSEAITVPLWSVALALAALAPFVARGLASMFERRAHERSARALGLSSKSTEAA